MLVARGTSVTTSLAEGGSSKKEKKKGFGLTCAPTGLGLAGTSIRRYCLGVPICQERPCVFSGADGRAGVYNVHG